MLKTKLYGVMVVFVVLMVLLSACGIRPSTGGEQVEVFAWPPQGAAPVGLDALVKVFKGNYPSIEFINAATAENAGTNAPAVLATRLQDSKPPDSWQGHAGQELISTYVSAKQIEPLNDLYKEEGWLDVMPKLLFPLISENGNIYSVPLNIRRANVLWYNPKILRDNGIAVPTTLDEWFAAMDTLQAAGVTPLATGEQWTKMLLMETILLATLGPDKYNNLWDGTTDWTGADVKAALENYQKTLTYTDSKMDSLSWQDAAQKVVNGDAAFFVMVDWTDGYFRGLGRNPNTDYGWAPVPGSAGMFQFLSDSFVLALGAPHRENALQWLKVVGSKEGQEAFNAAEDSMCVRTDCDRLLFGEYVRSAMQDWSSNDIVGSLTFGVVANDSWKSDIDTALGSFIQDDDLDAFQNSLAAACRNSGPCKES
jgi:glucose/mannose transport system substrate-binding protein